MKEKYQFSKEQEERFQLKAVKQYGCSIEYIDNPSEKVQLEAVRQDGRSILYIYNPSEEIQIEAVRQNWLVIECIKNPSLEVQLAAVRKNGCAIRYIKNPSEKVQLEAVRQDVYAIQYIKNPTSYISSIVDVVETRHRDIYVLHEPNKEPLFSTGCQYNISKDYFIWRIYNMNGGLEEHPYRQEYLDILKRY